MPARLLVVVPQLVVGGTERHLLQVLPRLADASLEVAVATTRGPGPLDAEMRAAGIEVIPAPRALPGRANAVVAAPALWRMMHRRRPDLVHFFLPEAYLLGAPAAIAAGVPLRLMSRRFLAYYRRRRPLASAPEPLLHRRMRALLANSRAVAADLAAEGVPDERLGLLYNGIALDRFAGLDRNAARQSLGLDETALVLSVVASLYAYKGHADLLEALAGIAGELPAGWRLLAAGDDRGAGPGLRRQADALGLSEHVRWLGEVADVRPVLAASDLGVLPSHEEGLPNAAIESSAAGLSMVVTDVAGSPEVVEHGTTGLVVAPHDPAALGRALLALARDPERRAAMGTAAPARAERLFGLDACVARYRRLYRGLLAGDTRPVQAILDDDSA